MEYRFSFKPYRRPFRLPLRTAHGLWHEREGFIVRLERADGIVGFGEVAPIAGFGTETVAAAGSICAGIGARVDDRVLDAVPPEFGCVRFALAAAREPLRPGVAAPRQLPVCALLTAGRAALTELPGKLEAGFLAFKWKVGVEAVDEELGLLDDLCGLLPDYATLRLDANGAWNRRQAEKWLARCAERRVEFVEQPAAPAERDLLLGLAQDYPVKLALDEAVTGLPSAREWQGLGWPGVFVIKPALAGPLAELADWARTTRADVVLSSAMETAVGRSAILRLALNSKLTDRALGFGVGEIFGERVWDGPVTGPLIDEQWCDAVNPEAVWNALN